MPTRKNPLQAVTMMIRTENRLAAGGTREKSTPVKCLDMMAYTIWNECRCKECCDDCKKGCCEKSHSD